MVRPRISEAIDATLRSFRGAGIEATDVSAILLVGGSSRIPLVAQMVAEALGRPISLDVHPKHAIALGAAMASSEMSQQAGGFVASPTQPEKPQPKPKTSPTTKAASGSIPRKTLLIAGIALAILLAIVAAVFFPRGGEDDPIAVASTTTTTEAAVTVVPTTVAPSTTAPTTTLPATTTTSPTTTTSTTVPEILPMPLDIEALRLTSIALIGDTYSVDYEANYEPLISTNASFHHIHFFWNVYDPATVGTNEPSGTRGSWQLWDKNNTGDQTFDAWSISDRPVGATAICGVPATSTHAVANVDRVDETFDCIPLPSS